MITAATAEGLVCRWQRSPAPSENVSVRPISQLDAQRIIDASAQRSSAAEKHFKRFCTAAFELKTAIAVAEARLSYSGRAASKGRQGSPASSHGGVAGATGRMGMSRASSETASLYADSFCDSTSALGGTLTHIPQPMGGGFTCRGSSAAGLPPAARNGGLSPRPAVGGRSASLGSSSASSSPRRATSGKIADEPAPRKPFYVSSVKSPSPKRLPVVEESPSSSPLGVRPSLRKHLRTNTKNDVPDGQNDSVLINPEAALTQFVDVNVETVARERPRSASSSLLRRQRVPQGPPSLSSAVNVAVEARAAEKRVSELIAHGRSIREGMAIETAVSRVRRGSGVSSTFNAGGRQRPRNTKEGGAGITTRSSLLSTQKNAHRPSSEREVGFPREPRVLSQITLSSATSAIDLSSDSD